MKYIKQDINPGEYNGFKINCDRMCLLARSASLIMHLNLHSVKMSRYGNYYNGKLIVWCLGI